jgi:pimeloyl-ACP methyl ester carboxylesterase
MDADMFAPQVEALAGSHRLVLWDQRGHGRTRSTGEPFTYWDSAEDLRALLDHLDIERAVVGGMSQGGFIGLRFALRHPARTAGLVLIDSQAGLEDPEKVPQYDLMLDVWTTQGPTDQLSEMVAATVIGGDARAWDPWIEKWQEADRGSLQPIYRTLMDRDDVTGRLGEIDVPALVVHGEEDISIPMSRAEDLCHGLRGCRGVVRVAGAGHASNLTHPEPVNAAIAEFMALLPDE